MGGHLDGTRLQSVDPTGILSDTIEPNRIIGCVAYPAAAVIAPGVIQHVEGDRFQVGELDGVETGEVELVSTAFNRAGLRIARYHDCHYRLSLSAVVSDVSVTHMLRSPFSTGWPVVGFLAASASSEVGLPFASRKRPILAYV